MISQNIANATKNLGDNLGNTNDVMANGLNEQIQQQLAVNNVVQPGTAMTPLESQCLDLQTGKIVADDFLEPQNLDLENTDVLEAKIDALKEEYLNDIQQLSPCSETINIDNFKSAKFQRISPEEAISQRLDFNENKAELKKQWEDINGHEWPKYESDVYSDNGSLIRKAGSDYDAHHIQPLGMGGQNVAENITPLHAKDHYDKQGIHASNSTYAQLNKILEA